MSDQDIVDRIRGLRYVHVPVASQLFEEAVTEIEKLRTLTRFQDRVIRSGDVACLTQEEREAIESCIFCQAIPQRVAVVLRKLVERMK